MIEEKQSACDQSNSVWALPGSLLDMSPVQDTLSTLSNTHSQARPGIVIARARRHARGRWDNITARLTTNQSLLE